MYNTKSELYCKLWALVNIIKCQYCLISSNKCILSMQDVNDAETMCMRRGVRECMKALLPAQINFSITLKML